MVTPNTCCTRLAADRLLWDKLQTLVDPDYRQSFARAQRRVAKNYGQAYLVGAWGERAGRAARSMIDAAAQKPNRPARCSQVKGTADTINKGVTLALVFTTCRKVSTRTRACRRRPRPKCHPLCNSST